MADRLSASSLFVPTDPAPDPGSVPTVGPGSASVPGASRWTPTELSRGPWDPDACHGGAPAALIAREVERVEMPRGSGGHGTVPMRLARLTIELLRPVPLRPLELRAEVVRPGRRVSVIDVTVRSIDDDSVLMLARALRIRTSGPGEVDMDDVGPGGPSAQGIDDAPPPVPPAAGRVQLASVDGVGFHSHGTEHRFARGDFTRPGPAFDWIRLAVPVVPDEEPSPWQRAAAASDFSNGIAASVGFGDGLFINPDLTVHLWREPVGEWVGLESVMRTSDAGIGASDGALWDEHGRIGRTNQSLFLDHL